MSNQREKILVKLVEVMGSCSFVESVTRDNPAFDIMTYLNTVPNTDLPRIAISSPAPNFQGEIQEARKSWGAEVVRLKFELPIDIYGIAIWPTNPDTEYGNAINEIYQALFTNELLDGLVVSMTLGPAVPPILFDPYYIFKLTLNVRYYTDSGI